jgi:hypothetical protein
MEYMAELTTASAEGMELVFLLLLLFLNLILISGFETSGSSPAYIFTRIPPKSPLLADFMLPGS